MRRSSPLSLVLVVAAALLAAGCARAPELPAPVVEGIAPAAGPVGERVEITIHGRNFYVRATPSLEGEPARIDAHFEARVGDIELEDVRRIDDQTLSAVVPAGLAAGRHALEVRGPYGSATKADAYEARIGATAALAARLRAPTECASGQRFEIVLEVENRGGGAASGVTATLESPAFTVLSGPEPASRLEAGATVEFLFAVEAGEPGEFPVEASVSAIDATSGGRVEASASAALVVRHRALLEAQLDVASVASVGQELEVALTVTNRGESSAVEATPALNVSGDGSADVLASPPARDLAAGESHTFTWRLQASGAGFLTLETTVAATDQGSGEQVAAPVQTAQLAIERPAFLRATLEATPQRVRAGEALTLRLVVANEGDAAATSVTPSLMRTGSASADIATGPAPASADIAGGASGEFVWELVARTSGTAVFEAAAQGTDANSDRPVAASTVSSEVLVASRAELAGTLFAPATANLGQEIVLELEVTNVGDSAALEVTPQALVFGGPAGLSVVEGPLPAAASIDGGAAQRFAWRLAASATGEATVAVGAEGRDAYDAQPVTMPTAEASLAIQSPAALSLAIAAPHTVTRNASFTVTATVSNSGESSATSVAPGTLQLGGTSAASLILGPVPATAEVPGGSSATFRWTVLAGDLGELELSVSASGLDANDGAPVTAPPASRSVIVAEATELFDDPFGDGTAASFVFAYGGKLYLAPDKNGSGAVRFEADGSAAESVSFAIARDTSGSNVSDNDAPAPYPSFGSTGCAPDTQECGPDNEDGRGFFTSGFIGATEWLVAGGAKSGGGLDYVYMTSDQDPVLDFSYVDLNSVGLSGQTKSLSAACAVGDRVYLAFPDSGGNRPYLLALLSPPTAPGLDATGATALQLDADRMPGIGRSAPLTLIDSMVGFADRLYLFNNGGCARATVLAPQRFATNPGDWAECTPAAAAWAAKTSVTATDAADLTPADRAVPQVAVHQGRLYAARNTTDGPQLWACAPEVQGDPLQCDPGDWSLVAANSTGDLQLTQFDNPSNSHLSLLVSTGNHLFVGFDNPTDGAVLFRSAAAAPASRADFEGFAGCGADLHPTACEGLSGNGLGDPTVNERIFSGVGADSFLYLTAGDGVGPLRVFRVGD